MPNPIRLFIAIELSQSIHDQLADLMTDLKKINWKTAKWVRSENIHLTLKFLGDTEQNKIAFLKSSLAEACKDTKPFKLIVKGTGVFPSRKNPHVLWAGVAESDELSHLYIAVEGAMTTLGYKKEDRPFSPHLTLARIPYIGDTAAMDATMNSLFDARSREFGTVIVRRITLFQSTLASGGSIYTPLAFIRFAE